MVEREWREASDLRTSREGLAAVLIAAVILRFWALGHGIPQSIAEDEPEIVERAFNMMRSGSLNPGGFFDYPALYIYIQFLVSVLSFLAGAVGGQWSSLEAATTPSVYLWGRGVTAAFGVATVWLVFRIGMRWGGRHALLAAALLAVMPLHVRYSHYVLTDVPLTFFVTLTLLLSLAAHEKNRLGAFALAGAAAGLSAATKYNGGLAIVLPLIAAWMTIPAKPSRMAAAWVIVGSAFAVFLLAAPYTVLDLPGFLNSFARLAGEYRFTVTREAPWLTYLKHLRLTFGWPALLLAGGGLGLGLVRLVRGPGRVRWALAVTFPLLYLWMVSRQNIVFARYLLPIVPSLCVLAAAAVVSGVSLLRRYEIPRAPRTALIAGLTVLALLPPALQSIGFNRTISKTTTADQAYEWITKNVPAGSFVVIESRRLLLPAGAFKSRNVGQLRGRSYQDYVDEGVDYLMASSQSYGPYLDSPHQFPNEYKDYMEIFQQSREVARFSPTENVPGPQLRIFKVRP